MKFHIRVLQLRVYQPSRYVAEMHGFEELEPDRVSGSNYFID